MCSANKSFSILPCVLFLLLIISFSGCGGGSSSTGMTAGSGGSSRSIPSYGEGTGSSGQTGAAHFLYVDPFREAAPTRKRFHRVEL